MELPGDVTISIP